MPERFDVIVVGGRPAGASLAARLGRRGRRVLVLERARLPSMPQVPTCPTLHMGTLAALDDLGVDESRYAGGAVRFSRLVLQFGTHFEAPMAIPTVHGRAYGYSIDRRHFDAALWDHLANFRTVTARQGFVVERVDRDAKGRVRGVTGRDGDVVESFEAPWVIGADGRFSGVARQVGAEVVEEDAEKVSSVLFADWEGVEPHTPGEDVVQIHATGKGLNVLMFPLPGGRLTLCLHERADRQATQGAAEAYYRAKLAAIPSIDARLKRARMVSRMVGLKRVGNGYRHAAGPGWALVGDALHYKDPVDGQGIYDALAEAEILAPALDYALAGDHDDATFVASYTANVRAATHPMFRATCRRLEDELYSEPPDVVVKTLVRWCYTDRAYQERFLRFLGRDVDPDRWRTPAIMAGAAMRGIGRDLAALFR